MFYADAVGVKKILQSLEKINKTVKARSFEPAPLLVKVANSGMTLAKYWKKHSGEYSFDKTKANL